MDDHQRRVTAPLLAALAGFEDGRATVGDIQAAAATAAGAIDNSNEELKRALERLDADLEEIQFAVTVPEQHAAVAVIVDGLRRALTLNPEQPYCDWCYGPMTDSARQGSEALGLGQEFSFACDSCLATHRYREPPDGWGEPGPDTPFRDA